MLGAIAALLAGLAAVGLAAGQAAPDTPGPTGALSSGTDVPPPEAPPGPTGPPAGPLPAKLLAGQVMMVGIPAGWSPARPAPLDSVPAGAVILFGRNIAPGMDAGSVGRLCGEVRGYLTLRHPGIPRPIIAIDHEGGRVNRLPGVPGITAFPSSLQQVRGLPLSAAVRKVEGVGRRMGEELASLGIDLDLAPVVDVVPDPSRYAIGTRSYGADSQRVGAFAAAFIRGMRATSTRCCAKHWPGYGTVRQDPHRHVVQATSTASRWLATDVPPFRAAVEAGVDALMTAHVIYPFMGRRPATVNAPAYTRLRDSRPAGIGFEGPVLTDDLEMAGVSRLYPGALGRLACDALDAGADMLLVCGKPASAIAAYRALVTHAGRHPAAFRAHAERVNRLRDPRP